MKKFYSFLLFNTLSCCALGQTCHSYIILHPDGSATHLQAKDSNAIRETTSNNRKSASPIIIGMHSIQDKKNKQTIRITASRSDMRCLDKQARILLDFDDFSDFEYGNDADDDCCDGLFVMNSPGYLMAKNTDRGHLRECLKDKLISSIRITCKEGVISSQVTPEQGKIIRETFRCLLDE